MSGQEDNLWLIKTMQVNPADSVDRFDDSTTDRNITDEVATFVIGGGGFNVERGHKIAGTPNCGRRFSVQIIVNLEASLTKKLPKSDEKLYLEEESYNRRLASENRALKIYLYITVK